ncbi:MoaB/Mog domain-containing protein [Sporodiniella umbellata]|nr:MoaB/Mog domain-containing protein [Sporodiniella umbellata]
MVYSVGILTVSDTASKDASLDKSGPTIKEFLSKEQYSVEQQCIVPDSIDEVQKTVKHWTDNLKIDLILLTGGTGFSERDKTPEAIRPLLTRETPGITHLLLSSSISITPMAALSRPVTGIRNKTIIVTFPGSPKACTENLSAIVKILPHALDLLLDLNQKHVKETHTQMQGHQCTHRQNEDDTLIGRSAPLGTPVSRRARHSPYPLISVKEAHHLIEKHVQRLNTVNMPVSQFLGSGYVLADTIKSLEPVPGYRASTVDGYAVYDGPGVYKVDSVALAEKQEKVITMHPGTIARVTTGGMIPDGANAVVMLEDTLLTEASSEGEEVKVEILDGATEGQNIREIGSDCSMDSVVGVEGQSVGPSEVALLASVGVRHAKVYRKPVVGVLSSGNEVMEHIHTDTLQPGQIRDTNRLSLLATIRNAGFEASDLGIVSDRVEEIHEAIEEALSRVDVLVTTGGVSMGEADFMKPVLEQKLGATIHFGRVLMKPGKPTTFATVPQGKKSKWVFALPGNPVSASVTFYLFVLPALKRMMGSLKTQAVVVPVKLTDNVKLDSRPEYHRVRVKVGLSGFKVESTGKQISSRVSSMSEANGLLELPAATPEDINRQRKYF